MQTITKHLIGGRLVDSHGGEIVEVRNPADNRLIGRVTMGDAVDAERAIAAGGVSGLVADDACRAQSLAAADR